MVAPHSVHWPSTSMMQLGGFCQNPCLVVEAGVAGAQAPCGHGAGGGVVKRGATEHEVHAARGDGQVHLRQQAQLCLPPISTLTMLMVLKVLTSIRQ